MQREAFFDNAKFILIFLVVFGHVIQPLTADSEFIQILYHWIYFFHMPAFILLSGFFAKGFGSTGYIKKLVKKLILPYLIFHVFYTAYYLLIGVDGWQTTVIYPRWSLWFLLSLFCWHLMLIIFKKLPPIFGIVIAFEIGILAGYVSGIGHTLSLSRTFVFFPFFLMGYWLTKKQLFLFKNKMVKLCSLAVLTTVAIGLAAIPSFSSDWLLGSHSYQALGSPEMGGLIRFAIYFISIVMTLSVLTWIPTRQHLFTPIGQKTIYVYLLHGIFIHFFRQIDAFKISNFIDFFGLAILSFAIVFVLSRRSIITISQPLIEGKWTLLKQKWKPTNT